MSFSWKFPHLQVLIVLIELVTQIFRPRMRELNRTPPLPPYLEFQAPDGSDVEIQTIPHQRYFFVFSCRPYDEILIEFKSNFLFDKIL